MATLFFSLARERVSWIIYALFFFFFFFFFSEREREMKRTLSTFFPKTQHLFVSLTRDMRTVPFAPVAAAAAAAASFASSSSSKEHKKKDNNKNKKIIFYTHSLCPYAHRVRLCLDELNLLTATDIVDIDLSNKPDWYLEKTNGRGLVPMIEFTETGECVRESLRINERLWETFETNEDREEEEEEQQQQQQQQRRREAAKRFANTCDQKFVSLGLQSIGGGWGMSSERNERTLERLEREIWEIEALMDAYCDDDGDDKDQRPLFLFGGRKPSLADLAIYPFAERFELALQHFQRYTLGESEYYRPDDVDEKQSHQPRRFQRWLNTMKNQKSVENAAVKDRVALVRSWSRTKRLDYFDYETADYLNP